MRGRGAEWADGASHGTSWAPAPRGDSSGASARRGHGELCALCVCLSQGVAATEEEVRRPQRACRWVPCSVEWICGKAKWDPPMAVRSLENDLDFQEEKGRRYLPLGPQHSAGLPIIGFETVY